MRILTSSFMCEMGKSSCNLAFGVILGTNSTEVSVGIESTEESVSCVKVLASTTRISLINYAVEKICCDNVCNINVVAWWGTCCGTRTLLAPCATVILTSTTVPILAAA